MTIKLHHALLAFFVFALITSLIRNGSALVKNVPFYRQLERDYMKEKEKNDTLKLDAVKSRDPYEIERILRDKLGFVKANEQMIVIPETPSTTPHPSPIR